MPVFYWQIGRAEDEIKALQRDYLQQFGWNETCNTPGSYWLWRRDFAQEDAQRHATWKERGPGPLGWPSEPSPHGVITANTDLAISMTARFLDSETEEPDEDDDRSPQGNATENDNG